jgi:putative tricarboxylic transport membrane protein
MVSLGEDLRSAFIAIMLLASLLQSAVASPPREQITIYVPGAENGGFDRTAVAIKRALIEEGLVKDVTLVRSPGAGGLVALAQFAGRKPDGTIRLIIGGQSILGSARYNRSAISLRDVVPIARMNGIALVIVVRADSPIRDWQDLSDLMRSNTDVVKWIGGSEGSADSQLLTILANQLRIPRNTIAYSAIPGGGDAITQQILDGSHAVAISSYEELAENLANDKFRAIAVSSDFPVAGLTADTLQQQGVDIAFNDWKGVFSTAGTSAGEQQKLIALFAALARSQSWKEELRAQGWNENFLAGSSFGAFVEAEDKKLGERINQSLGPDNISQNMASILSGPYRYAAVIAFIASLIVLVLFVVNQVSRRNSTLREAFLKTRLDEKEAALAEMINSGTGKYLADVTKHIDTEFARWTLSDTEKDIAWLILKGFSFLEIAEMRGRSERTIRQQAGAIYAKSGMRSRAELSAFFLEDLFES